jgi:SAM-dependent methyltransferase
MLTPDFRCGCCAEHEGELRFVGRDTQQNQWSWATCAACGSVSLTPRPTADQLSKAYGISYYGSGEAKFDGVFARFIQHYRQMKAARLAKRIARNSAVLDIGCGDGSFLSALGKLAPLELHGTELEGSAAQRAQRHPEIKLHIGDAVTAGYRDEQFDLVTLFHVFEHLSEPILTLNLVHKILKPGGLAVLSFPNGASFQARLFKSKWLHLDPPRHLFIPNPVYLEKRFIGMGFAVVGRRTFSIEQNPFGFIQSLLNTIIAERDVLFERLKGNRSYAPRHRAGSLLLQKAAAAFLLVPAIIVDAIESACGRGATIEYILRKDR